MLCDGKNDAKQDFVRIRSAEQIVPVTVGIVSLKLSIDYRII